MELRKFSTSSYGMRVMIWCNDLPCSSSAHFFPALDSIFETVLYTSDSDQLMRYTDEGETNELCRCYVDLAPLPNFQAQASAIPSGGFYTGMCAFCSPLWRHNQLDPANDHGIDFELGFELDTAGKVALSFIALNYALIVLQT